VNAAVLLFSACLAGADPAPPPAAPVVAYPAQAGDCGKSSCCEDKCNKICSCFDKIKAKLCCWKDKWKDKFSGCCDKCKANKCEQAPVAVAPAPPPPAPVYAAPSKDCCGKARCCDIKGDCCGKSKCCEKNVCAKVEPSCGDKSSCGDKCCWKPGYFLHKCKAKLCGLCSKDESCGGCGTAATPGACGSTVIPPATVPPVKPADPKKIPEKVGSAYPLVAPGPITVTPVNKVIDLTPTGN
jgi:hypothetical protein